MKRQSNFKGTDLELKKMMYIALTQYNGSNHEELVTLYGDNFSEALYECINSGWYSGGLKATRTLVGKLFFHIHGGFTVNTYGQLFISNHENEFGNL